MSVIFLLSDLMFYMVDKVIRGAYWILILLVAAFVCALVFNVVHELMGGR